MTQTIAKDTPLSEIVLRKYEKPNGAQGRELVRKLCLSTGLLQPGDSRDVIVDIFHALLEARGQKKELSSEEIQQWVTQTRQQLNLPIVGIAPSNIRRQLKRLRDLFLVEKRKNRYRVTEFDALHSIFEEKVEQYLIQNIVGRVKDYVKRVDEEFG